MLCNFRQFFITIITILSTTIIIIIIRVNNNIVSWYRIYIKYIYRRVLIFAFNINNIFYVITLSDFFGIKILPTLVIFRVVWFLQVLQKLIRLLINL